MGSLNKVQLIGRLGRDPETKHTQSGKAVTNFSIATDEEWTDGAGQKQKRTEWHSIVAWDKRGEVCAKYLAKGLRVYVEGKLQSREYEKDGIKRRVWEVNALNVVLLDFKGQENGGGARGESWESSEERFPSDAKGIDEDEDSDIPFGR